MKIRNIATIYIFDENKILLMHRIGSRLFSGDIWVGIGGHFAESEMNDPAKCALRELWEESGLCPGDIGNLRLKYITTRKAGDEIRQQYVFMANLRNKSAELRPCDEGELHWIPLVELFARKMAYSNTQCLKHYLGCPDDETVYLCAAGSCGDKLSFSFTALCEYGTNR